MPWTLRVGDLGLDGVADLGAEEMLQGVGDLEGALDDGRADDDAEVDVGAVDGIGGLDRRLARACRGYAGARVEGFAGGDGGEQVPAIAAERKRELGEEVEALDDAGGGEVGLGALEAGNGAGEGPEEGGAGDGVVDGLELESGNVEDVDLLAGLVADWERA